MNEVNPYASAADTHADVAASDIPRLEPPQSVEYRLSAETLATFWAFRTLTSPAENRMRSRVGRRMLLAGGLPAIAMLVLAYHNVLAPWVAVPGAMFLVALIAVVYHARRPSSILLAYAQAAHRLLDEAPNAHFLSDRTVTLETAGVRQKMPASESFIAWEAFQRIDHDDDCLYLFDSSFTAVIVPRAAFATRGQFLGFVELARRLRGGKTTTSIAEP